MTPKSQVTTLNAVSNLVDAIKERKLVAVVGTGVSLALTENKFPTLSWKGLVEDGFDYGLTKGKITPVQHEAWKSQIGSNDLDDLLSAAEFMGRKLSAPNGELYIRWLANAFGQVRPENIDMQRAILTLKSAGVPICTLNYDTLLEEVTGLSTINIQDISKVTAWIRHETDGILHLHGSWDVPGSCILGIRDYEATLSDEVRDLIQRTLSSFSRLLFVGCGDTFADPNFSALITWLRAKMMTAVPQHYALVKGSEVPERHADVSWHGFVEPLSYGVERTDLPKFIQSNFGLKAAPKVSQKSRRGKSTIISDRHERIIETYRSFLLKDCGQMTIEGVRADMDTAQRRFDLERLFVPLDVVPVPPEIPENDPARAEKLKIWEKANKGSLTFGDAFRKHKRLALLALPGGGKTVLLKRLAVAYADPKRLQSSNDALPDLNLVPVLIRCREWREYITRPIPVLLQNIAAITGQAGLTGLYDALIPLLKKGQILLLIDGLDEIHDDADRSTFVDHLEAFLAEFNNIYLVVTSREAGFSLVAPSLARFCQRWRVAPLQPDAITALCNHWHLLMTGGSPDALNDANEVAERILDTEALRRLAEVPLLLTMLLVVKHGAGRLPPDRVSLYERAVEVLLDTWNIKGHDPLNVKEAVPQLAYVAFQLMREGKQTATEIELLALLEEARDKVPQIRRYAKDTPHDFLKRVELRSSLLVEAGYQKERLKTVPFYQFRHLTFQEYLAAVAAVEGHYNDYKKGDTILSPLQEFLTAPGWKEVIPMAAVLARKQAEPLLLRLLNEANALRQLVQERGDDTDGVEWGGKLPPPVSRLAQCMIEEAEIPPDILVPALQVIAFFTKGGTPSEDWVALSRGPYGEDLIRQAWALHSSGQVSKDAWLRNSIAFLSARQKTADYWRSADGRAELTGLLRSTEDEKIVRGLLTVAGFYWGRAIDGAVWLRPVDINLIERHLFNDNPVVWDAATWAWAFLQRDDPKRLPSREVLDRLLTLWLSGTDDEVNNTVAFALSTLNFDRECWRPQLSEKDKQFVQAMLSEEDNSTRHRFNSNRDAALIVAFYAGDIVDAGTLSYLINEVALRGGSELAFEEMLEQLPKRNRKRGPRESRRRRPQS
jgi:hypothetical protein